MIRIVDGRGAKCILAKRSRSAGDYEGTVLPIIKAIKTEGDRALFRYARELDGLGTLPLRVSQDEIRAAGETLNTEFTHAVQTAVTNIRQFAEAQLPREKMIEFSPGRKLGWIVRPLASAGCYIPSGRYALPSTLLMTAVLAQTAGVKRICVASPKPSTEMLGCAHLLGIDEVYRVGGAQAIAAMAFGTETILPVDRIVGPGNAYVATAKKLLAGDVGIDFVAGPTEITIIAADGDPKIIAADMLAQAEHDVTASAILLTTSRPLAVAVSEELENQLQNLQTADVARSSLSNGSFIAVLSNMEEAVALSNRYAPEHLSLHDPSLLPEINNAGTVFLGSHSPESAGDYASGPSHVLPTGGAARLRGGLSTVDFVKVITIQELSPSALEELTPAITTLARAEGLEAHARAVEVRSVQ